MENKKLTHLERIKSIRDIAIEYKMPIKKIFDIYNKINDALYKFYNELVLYNPDIENITFASVKRYLNLLN